MSFLQKLLNYRRVCIQCHNNPDADAIASAFGVHRYLKANGVDSFIVYGGTQIVKKSCIKLLIKKCEIPICHVSEVSDFDLLLYVDCQNGQGNVQAFPAEKIMIIDHHIKTVENSEDYLVKSSYQSCSTIIWELLKEEGYPLKEDEMLSVALLYGLYTDTSCFADLFGDIDTAMRKDLFADQPLFELLIKSNMTVAELMVASDAMHNHYFDVERRFAIVEALSCDQTVLGIIGDFMIQVDIVNLSFAYTSAGGGYQISLRTCGDHLFANKIAAFVCEGIGNGGGHAKKAGGYIHKDKLIQQFGEKSIFDVINSRLCQYFEENNL